MQHSNSLYRKRKLLNRTVMVLCSAAALFGIFWLLAILATLLWQGVTAIEWSTFTERTRMSGGGLGNAILGSIMLTLGGTIIGTIIGVGAGTWLAEYGRNAVLGSVIRFINDVLLSAPSVIIGLFIYALVVLPMGHFSGWAGILALAVIVIPVVIRATEDMLKLVPDSLREAASAMGAHRWWVVVRVCYSGARAGIITGILLACARISGETAPLIFTSLNSNQWNFFDLGSEMPNLPMTIYQNMTINSFIPRQVELAWGGALILTLTILVLNIIARFMSRDTNKR
ncbi:phosphate ABC transporter permease PstA [Carnimonas nigrificans]|uniref:phosphate ABC transporter permease PstA n=1 Tax=Carnimonas nigrificans TaxID=64323 RepID=UPI00047246B8|nr:phosphate ABC transporter permease PstA [Carnimonas nigrificans]